MTKKTAHKEDKPTAPEADNNVDYYYLPDYGAAVEATSQEEAIAKAEKIKEQ